MMKWWRDPNRIVGVVGVVATIAGAAMFSVRVGTLVAGALLLAVALLIDLE